MKRMYFWTVALLGGMALVSCSSTEEVDDLGETKSVVDMRSEPQYIEMTDQQRMFVLDNNQFTLNFLKTANDADKSGKSFIYSPLSITYVLGMTNDAAVGETEKELEQRLGFNEGGIQAVNDFCKKLIDGLPKVDDKVQLNIANAIFLNKDYQLKQQFEQDMQEYYDAKAEALDFSSPKTLSYINDWCSKKTNGMIPTILDEVEPNMVSYLLNAIYFKADWASKFDEKNTKTETFTTENGTTQLPLMHQKVLISYLKNATCSAVIIPYGSGLWNMTVLLPEAGKTTDDVINMAVNTTLLNNLGWCGNPGDTFHPCEVDLKLPRFKTASDTDNLGEGGLISLLRQMGIRRVFDSNSAQIPNMTDVPVYIKMMRQKAAIEVNEEGSEAAAVTAAASFVETSMHQEYPKASFHANRPFVYVIREASSGAILFVGKFTGKD